MKKLSHLLILTLLLLPCLNSFGQIPSYVPTDSLVGWWPFNGNANDESGNGNNGTVNGASLTSDRYGVTNQAYNFDSDYIRCTNPGPLGNTSRTVSFWAKTSSSETNGGYCISYGNDNINGGEFGLRLNRNCIGPTIDVSGSAMTYDYANANNSIWHHYVVSYDNLLGSDITSILIYIDGILESPVCDNTNASSNDINTATEEPITFGRWCDLTGFSPIYFDGDLDDIGIWNRALTECEIKQLYYTTLFDLSISEVTVSPELFGEDGSIDISVSGGTPPYQFDWDNDGTGDFDDSEDLTGISGGTYIVVVKDDIGCVEGETDTIVVPSQLSITETSTNEILIFPNPASNIITIQVNGNFEYKLLSLSGETILVGQATDQANVEIRDIATGQYIIEIDYQNKKEIIQLVKK